MLLVHGPIFLWHYLVLIIIIIAYAWYNFDSSDHPNILSCPSMNCIASAHPFPRHAALLVTETHVE